MLKAVIKHKKKSLTLILGLFFSQPFAEYTIGKHSINSGGGEMSGGSYSMNASIGQIDASSALNNGNYSLNGGFWHENTDLIYKNGFE